jgi:MFS family permease
LPAGILTDRVGRKHFILLGGVVTLLGYLSYSFSKSWLLLGAGMVLVSLDQAIRSTATTASLGDAGESESLGRVFSLDLGATETAASISPLIGGFVATNLGVSSSLIFGASAMIMAGALVLVWVGYKPASIQKPTVPYEGLRKLFTIRDRRLMMIVFFVALDAAAWRISFPFWTLYVFKVMRASQAQLGITIAISTAIPALTGLTLGPRLDRIGRKTFLALSEWSSIGAFLPLLFGTRVEFAYFAGIFWGLVYSLWVPALYAYAVDHFGREKFGQTLGTMSLVSGVTSAASPLLGGWLWDNVSPKAPLIVTLILAVIIGCLIWLKLEEHPAQIA